MTDPISHNKLPLSTREWIYRGAYEMGRTPTGYEVQKILALVDFFAAEAAGKQAKIGVDRLGGRGPIGAVLGALDERIAAVCSSGYFDNRNDLWQEPIDRNLFGLLEQFGDAELASLIALRRLIVEAAKLPSW